MRALIVTDNSISASIIRRGMRDAAIRDVTDRYAEVSRPCRDALIKFQPDLVLVDETRTPEHALERVAEARATLPNAKLVLLASSMDAEWLARASAAGIDAAIRKTPRALSFGALLREIAAGNVFHAFAPPTRSNSSQLVAGLTPRELEILRLVAAGASNGAIGRELWVTEQTVKFHLSNVYRKLAVSNRTEASHRAYVNGLLDISPATGVAA